MCEVVVVRFQHDNFEKFNLPSFFPTWKVVTEVATLAASGGFFQILSPHVVHTKIFV